MPTLLIDGKWVSSIAGETIDVINPCDAKVFGKIDRGTAADIDLAVHAARRALDGAWGRMTATERGRIMMKFADLIVKHADEIAKIEAQDTGKPMTVARNDIVAVARYFEFYGSAADKIHGEQIPYLNNYNVQVIRVPHGVTAHIIPWNYPGYGHEAGAALTAHPGINFATFTGSPEVGVMVQEATAKNSVPCVLELGGKSPQIVFNDVDFDKAVPVIVKAITQNAGQTCSAGSRLLVQQDIYDQFVGKVAEAFKKVKVGTPEMDLDCGPIVNKKQFNRVNSFIDEAIASGVPLLARGVLADGISKDGYFVAPALFGAVPREHNLACKEVFGPVLSAMPFKDEEDAVQLANATEYGLVAGVWTENGSRQSRLAQRIDSGQVFINCYGAGGGVELPFGGMKKSGHGREKGFLALEEFSVTKTVVQYYG